MYKIIYCELLVIRGMAYVQYCIVHLICTASFDVLISCLLNTVKMTSVSVYTLVSFYKVLFTQ